LKIYLHSLKQQKMRLITRVDHTINSMDLQSPGNTKTI
ncbi:restriction endonuclease, partial [Salmonella enterica subsp. enterica serovar Enteritidis]|nr:restriction endonuclease [Salmonella enterica subsp. enterica serovar Enteritidis]